MDVEIIIGLDFGFFISRQIAWTFSGIRDFLSENGITYNYV
jgi:hypothetical protein